MTPDHCDRKPMIPCRFKNIDAAGLHGRPCLVAVFTGGCHVAFLAEPAGTRPHAPGLVMAVQKDLDLKTDQGFIEVRGLSSLI